MSKTKRSRRPKSQNTTPKKDSVTDNERGVIFRAVGDLFILAGNISLTQLFGFSEEMIQTWTTATLDNALLLFTDPENLTESEREIAEGAAERYYQRMKELGRIEGKISEYLDKLITSRLH